MRMGCGVFCLLLVGSAAAADVVSDSSALVESLDGDLGGRLSGRLHVGSSYFFAAEIGRYDISRYEYGATLLEEETSLNHQRVGMGWQLFRGDVARVTIGAYLIRQRVGDESVRPDFQNEAGGELRLDSEFWVSGRFTLGAWIAQESINDHRTRGRVSGLHEIADSFAVLWEAGFDADNPAVAAGVQLSW